MSTSTGANGAGIQLPSMEWEMEEGAGAPAGSSAPRGAAAVPAAAEAPTEQVAVPEYGPVTPAEAAPVAVPDPGYGPGEEPGGLEPVAVEGGDPESGEPFEEPGRRRFKRPALVAAATAGVVLMGLPFLITDGADGSKDKRGDGRGVSQADHQLVDGPEIGDVPPPAPTDPPTTGAPTPAPTEPPATGEPPATAQPLDPTGTVPGIALGGTAGVPAVPGNQPAGGTAPVAKAPVTGTQQSGNTKTTQQSGGGQPSGQQQAPQQPAPQQPAPQQPAPQQPAPQQPAPQQPAPQQPAPQQPAPQQPAPQQPAPPPPAAAKATYNAVGGSNCGTSSVSYAQNGWYDQGSTGWTSSSTGGHKDANCNGKYVSMPMSGSATKDDNDNSVVWTFSTSPVVTGSCEISVWVPNNSDIKAVGGAPAYYTVQNTSTPNSGKTGEFTIDQPKTRGNWVNAGKFGVSGGKIAVMLHSRGLDWSGTATEKAHIAASAVRANCTAS
ncbi:hypothetical protein GCM10009639_29750 [Kitasatospora putterlickiae]|uniref:Translation initiation factor IF-2 n=1 Tax=Kitasatospora putterlickiae TaxID=221725 RepID=A0ABN1Y142_9ACTN